MPKYKVTVDHLQYGIKRDDRRRIIEPTKIALRGDVLELTEKEAEAMTHAVEPLEKPAKADKK